MNRFISTLAAAGCTIIGGLSAPNEARAVDTEVFFGSASEGQPPNILFILDTSRSMFTLESSATESYDPGTSYPGACSSADFFFYQGATVPANLACSASNRIPEGALRCPNVLAGINSVGGGFAPAVQQAWRNNAQWRSVTRGYSGQDLYCQGESGLPGDIRFPVNGNPVTIVSGNYINYRSSTPTAAQTRIDAVKGVVDEFITNAVATGVDVNAGFMRHYWGGSVDTFGTPAAGDCGVLIDPVEDSGSALGGIVVLPVHPIGDPAFTFFDRMIDQTRTIPFLDALRYKLFDEMVNPSSTNQCPIQLFTPGGRSPIAASMYEALLYYGGFNWSAGNTGKIGQNYDYRSVNESLVLPADPQSSDFNNNTLYKSPIMDALCAGRNYIVLLSDGTTELDSNSDNPITSIGWSGPAQSLARFPKYIAGSNPNATGGNCRPDDLDGLQPSECLDDIADYMATWGVKPPKSPGVPDDRGLVKTFTIGLSLVGSPQEVKARELLRRTADRGRGLYYEATSPEALLDVLNTVLRTILQDAASFSSPTVAVNAFNRTQNLNELYMSVFEPDFRYRWRGNLKKYKLQPIPDTTTNPSTIRFGIYGTDPDVPAVDAETGFFSAAGQSFWTPSDIIDGDRVRLGGAASRIPTWDTAQLNARSVYSNLSGSGPWNLTASGNGVNSSNIPDAATLGKLASDPYVTQQMVDWLRGRDTEDHDSDGDRNETRFDMGDPLHGKPAVALYGGTADAPTGYIYLATNDGFLHAISTETGQEAWAFIPSDLLIRTRDLMFNRVADPEERGYGLDGSVRQLRIDRNGNGLIEPTAGDKVYLFFGQRRGGSHYFGMDVSNPLAPVLMWTRGRGDSGLTELGDSWSTPTIARVRINGANCANGYRHNNDTRTADDCDVIIVGGGYDSNEDLGLTASGSTPYLGSTQGRALYMLDAYTGQVRWSAGLTGSGANLQFAAMSYAIPSEVRVLELTNDGFADRMYVGDLGGQLWRFDIVNGQDPANLVQGGVLAEFGGGEDAEARRFFYPPDVSSSKGWFNVAIGSGHREFPNSDVITQNAFLVIRDRAKLARIATADYPDPPLQFADLPSVSIDGSTNVGADAPGWKLVFSETGEKVLAESATFDGTVFFTSYTPRPKVSSDACSFGFGVNKLYTLNVVTAGRVDRNDDGFIDSDDPIVVELAQSGIAPEPVFVFPSPTSSETTCIGQECRPRPICLVGLEDCGQGLSNRPVRTYWRQRGVVDAVN